jgi:hypothetical protein
MFRSAGTHPDLPIHPEIATRSQKPSRYVHDDFLALLWADCLGAHLPIFAREFQFSSGLVAYPRNLLLRHTLQ